MSNSRMALCLGVVALLGACDGDDTRGEYPAVYEVPVPAELASAASYPVDTVEWEVRDGIASLKYDLPAGLIGKELRIEMEGPIDEDTQTASLTGVAGTATCEISAVGIECLENMPGLMPIEPDLELVEALAADQYDGPVADRLDVAKRFAGDPIGIVRFELDDAQ